MVIKKGSSVFLLYVLIFTLDAIINYYLDLPIYVLGLTVFSVVLLIPNFLPQKRFLDFVIITSIFFVVFIINSFRMGFYKESFSDFLFINSFFGAYFLFSDVERLTIYNYKLIRFFLFCCLVLFIVSFLGIDKNVWGDTMGIKTSDIEFSRSYRQGFFRKAHIASYFFTFFCLFYLNRIKRDNLKRIQYLTLILPIIIIILLTGSRTPIVVIFISLVLYYFRIKYLKYLIPFLGLCIMAFAFIDKLLVFFNNTIFYQYFTMIKTFQSNFDRLSRVIIWSSWWKEIGTFTTIDFLIGRGFNSSLEANLENTSNRIWFHNDFLSIFYSYGIIAIIIYIYLFVMMYKKHKSFIKQNIFIFLMFHSFWLSAFFNGFYYYYTILVLFLFYQMIYMERNYNKHR